MGLPSWEAVLVFLGGVIATLLGINARRSGVQAEARKADKEGEASLSEATIAWAKHLQETLNQQIKDLRSDYESKQVTMQERLVSLESELRIYQAHNRLLITQIIKAGMLPVDPPALQDLHRFDDG